MRFHVLGVPHTISSKAYAGCAFTQKVVKFCKMMHSRGHEVIHYGHELSEVDSTEHVTVVSNSLFKEHYTEHWSKELPKFNVTDPVYQAFYRNAIRELFQRKRPGDFLLPFWGSGVRPVCDAHSDILVVEPGIGYGYGHWAPFKVFESYAMYHSYCGLSSVTTCEQKWYDVVIPNYFDLSDFEYSDQKQDYFLYIGRVYSGKGIDIAIQATEKTGKRLIIAGPGSLKEAGYTQLPPHVTEFGFANPEQRKALMRDAKAALLPSLYNEPFCGTQIECLLSGTPTITTDWGAFTENNIEGITGYRCRTFGDFIDAINNIDKIRPAMCRAFGKNFSLESVAPMYENYFQNILNIYTKDGWYTMPD